MDTSGRSPTQRGERLALALLDMSLCTFVLASILNHVSLKYRYMISDQIRRTRVDVIIIYPKVALL